MPPAARAFLVRGFGNRCARFLTQLKFQLAQDKKLFEFFLRDLSQDFFIASQRHGRFQSIADEFLLARGFDRLADDSPQIQQLRHLLFGLRIFKLRRRFRKGLQMDRTG